VLALVWFSSVDWGIIRVGTSSVREDKVGNPSSKREGFIDRRDCRLMPENIGSMEEPSPENMVVT